MGVKRGTPKAVGSGRKKGVPNKRTDDLVAKLEALNHDTVALMLGMLSRKRLAVAVRAKLLCELMQYQFPKRKALEHSGEVKEMCTINITGA